MNIAMKNNAVAGGNVFLDSGAAYSTPLFSIKQPFFDANTGYYHGIRNAVAMQYEPTLRITNPGEFTKRENDPTNAVFGFQNIVGHIIPSDSSDDENYNRLILRSWLADTGSVTVLNNVWPNAGFNTFDGGHQLGNYRGHKWFLTINMRRLNPEENDTLDNQPVLTLKLPYKQENDNTGYIKFIQTPCNSLDSTFIIPSNLDYRGIEMKMQSNTTTEIQITRNMLPVDTDTLDINLVAYFVCDGGVSDTNNVFFKGSRYSPNSKIDSLNIEVTYLGNLDIAIDYIKIEEIHGYYVYRGMIDSLGILDENDTIKRRPAYITIHPDALDYDVTTDMFSIKDVIQTAIDSMKAIQLNGVAHNQLFRFYGQDVESSNPVWWGQLRYFNLVTNGMAIARDNLAYSEHYEYYTKAPNRYVGIKLSENEHFKALPYNRQGKSGDFRALKFKRGFLGHPAYEISDTLYYGDTLRSRYETYFYWDSEHYYDSITKPGISNERYIEILDCSHGALQPSWEDQLIERHTNAHDNEAYHFLYSDKPWWQNFFLGSNWELEVHSGYGTTDDKNACCQYLRPKTGEETRLLVMNSIIMGAKGLLYDREEKDPLPQNRYFGIGDGTVLDSSQSIFLYSDEVGADFMKLNNDKWNFDDYVNFDTVSNYLIIDKNRVYIGMKSTRIELKKIHDWIRENDSLLMRLRLSAWYGKSFKTWYHQDTEVFGTDTILADFISLDTNKIKIRPIGRDTAFIPLKPWYRKPYYEPWDSIFFDITLLRDVNDDSLTSSVFYIGIQNRRTDPLFRIYDTLSTSPLVIDSSMKFFSTAEFEDSCAISLDTSRWSQNPDKWRACWWKRQGAREITIPFNYIFSDDDRKYALLHVSELGHNNTTLNNLPWRNSIYYHTVDTVVGQDKSVVLKLLPGQGKILKVEILPPFQRIKGELTYSNQRKLIGYPIIDPSDVMNVDSLYYHLVYHRVDSTGRSRVFYRRSNPVHLDTANARNSNIVWQVELCLSDSVRCIDAQGYLEIPTDCKYPSIVVRYDTVLQKSKVYIVYVCRGRQSCPEPGDCPNSYVTIVESLLNADDSAQAVSNSRAISNACGEDYEKWGVSMINASRYGNYYVWSDSLKGIVSAWKRPDTNYFYLNFDFSSSSLKWNPNIPYKALHPSVNSYSRIEPDENDCAVIWQEKNDPDPNSSSSIYYSLLTINSTGTAVNHHLTDSIGHENPDYIYNSDTTIVRLSYPNEENSYPVIYRALDNIWFYPTHDHTSWESYRLDSSISCFGGGSDYKKFINSLLIMHRDLYGGPLPPSTEIYPRSRIMSLSNSLIKPNLSQGVMGHPDSWRDSPKAVIFEFNETDTCSPDQPDPRIWQYPHGHVSFCNFPYNYIENEYMVLNAKAKKIHSKGKIPQLAARQFIGTYHEMWKNRRVFEADSTISDIITSSKEFYKGNIPEIRDIPFIGFSDSLSNSYISNFNINGKIISYDILYIYPDICDTCSRNRSTDQELDTIPTLWFNVSNDAYLDFFSYGLNINHVKLFIEKKINRNKIRIDLRNVPYSKLDNLSFRLINGRNNEYRLLFTRENDTIKYSENVILMHDPYQDRFYKRSGDEIIIDLGGMIVADKNRSDIKVSIYPNPADEKIYVTAYLPVSEFYNDKINDRLQSLTLTIYSTLGNELFKTRVDHGATIAIPTDKIPTGIYYLRAEQKVEGFQTQFVPPSVQPFVIER